MDSALAAVPSRFRTRGWLVAVGGAAFAAVVLLGVLITMRTPDGTLIVEVSDPDATIEVIDGQGKLLIERKAGAEKVEISAVPGKGKLRVVKNGVELLTKEFSLVSGGRETVNARLEPSKAGSGNATVASSKTESRSTTSSSGPISLRTAGLPKIVFGRWFPMFNSPDQFYEYEADGDVRYHSDRLRYHDNVIELHNGGARFKVVARDVSVRAKAKAASSNTMLIALRDCNEGGYFARFLGGSRFEILKKVTGKPPYALAAGDSPQPPGEFFNFEFSAIGDMLTVSVDGQPLLVAHDTTHSEGMAAVGVCGGSGLFKDVAVRIPSKESLVADNRGPLPPPEPNAAIMEKADAADGTHKTVDLLKLVDLGRDVIRGTWWKFGDGAIACDPAPAGAFLEMPYVPPREYDYRIVFVSTNANEMIEQVCTGGSTRIGFGVGEFGNTVAGFHRVGGQWINCTTTKANVWLVSGRRHVSVVKVRKDSVEGWFDGRKITGCPTDWTGVNRPCPAPRRYPVSACSTRCVRRIGHGDGDFRRGQGASRRLRFEVGAANGFLARRGFGTASAGRRPL